MRLIFSILLFFLFTLPVKPQSWYPANAFDTGGGYVYEIAAIDSNLYIGGSFTMYIGDTPTYSIAKWNGTQWDSLSIGIDVNPQWGTPTYGTVFSIRKYKGEIYAGGQFTYAGYIVAPKLAKWNGTGWDSVNTIYNGPGTNVYSLEIFENKLYVGGAGLEVQDTNGNSIPIISLGTWNDTLWEEIPAGRPDGIVTSLIFNGELYVGGLFGNAGGVPVYNLGRWDGTQWKSCELGTTDAVGWMELDSVNNKLYVSGGFDYVVKSDSTGIYCKGHAIWDGNKWSAYPELLGFRGPMNIYHGKLYCGGSGSYQFAAWDGQHWDTIGGPSNAITALGNYDDTLFVGGASIYIVDSNGDTIYSPYLVRYWTPNYCDSIHSFTLSADTVYISDSTIVQFAPAGFANQYQWGFGASTSSDTAALQSHYFDSVGVNYVKLIATYGLCPWDTVIKTVTVINDCQQTIITVPDTVVKNTVIQFTGNNPEATQWQWLLGSTLISDTTNAIYFFDSAGIYTVTVITSYKNCFDTVTTTVIVVNALGVEELAVGSGSRQLRIYPNPAGGSFTVEIQSSKVKGKSSKVEIYDVKGKLVYQSEIFSSKTSAEHSRSIEIPSENWTKGNYFVNLVLEGKTIAREKVVVE